MSIVRTAALQHPSATSPAITLNNTGSADVVAATINSGPLAGFRNAVINGNFDHWQKATSHSTTGYGSADRWVNAISGSASAMSRQSFTLGQTDVPGNPRYFCRAAVTSVAGASNYAILMHRIEDVRTFSGQTVTVSFCAKADASRSIAIEFVQSFGTGGGGSADVSAIGSTKFSVGTAWQKITLTVTIPSITGKTLGAAGDDHLGLFIWLDGGSSWNSRNGSLGQQSGTFDIAMVQVEPGSFATPFEQRPRATELALCKRYGQWVPFNQYFNASAASVVLESTIVFPEMRKTPVAGALVADPNTTQAAALNSANVVQRLTPYGGSCFLQASAAGASYVIGYRSWLDAEL